MEFNANSVKEIQCVMNPERLRNYFWLERKIISAAIDNVNYISTPWDYPYYNAGEEIQLWCCNLGFKCHRIDDKVMISW